MTALEHAVRRLCADLLTCVEEMRPGGGAVFADRYTRGFELIEAMDAALVEPVDERDELGEAGA